jgi:hypothetical protein
MVIGEFCKRFEYDHTGVGHRVFSEILEQQHVAYTIGHIAVFEIL